MAKKPIPSVLIENIGKLTETYCKTNRRLFVEGCLKLKKYISGIIYDYLNEKYSKKDVVVIKRYMVQMRFRQDFVKNCDQITNKLMKIYYSRKLNSGPFEECVKNLDSITFSKFIEKNVTDLSGMEIVLPYKDMILEISEKIVECLKDRSDFKILNRKNYFKNPQESGYRAAHFIFEYKNLPFELQIKTFLHSAWSRYTHDFVYKPQDTIIPSKLIRLRFKNLADLLTTCDNIAQEIFQTYLDERNEKKKRIGV